MSVVGFDLGCQFSKVAVAHRKKIQVVPNELTKLLTPTLTAFSERERFFGDGALTQYNRNFKNTIAQIKRWLGRKANDPKIENDAGFWLPGVTTGALPDGRFGISVETSQGQIMLAPEQILSGFLGQLKKFTTGFLEGLKVTDCVIACPSYFDDSQRRALLTAAKLAELKEETTAVALNYGILRNLPENETQRVVFFDFGYASTQVAIVDFIKGKLSVRYKAANPFIGGRDLDRAMYQHFRKQWQEKYNVDINTKPKQKLKLIRACEKIKKLLTGNKDALWTLDCFYDDNDFKLMITREEMEKYATELKIYDGMLEPLIEALEATKDDKVKIHSCEIIGGPSRVTSVQTKVLEIMQKYEPEIKALSTTLNGDESVARGCALMCAMLSPNFRVKEFQVQDILTWPITISYPTEKQADQKIIEQLIMQRGNPQPCTAKVMFNKTQNFVFKLQHPEEYKTKDTTVNIEYPMKTNLNIGEFNVQLLPLSQNAVQPPKIKLLLDINKQGLLDWPKASLIEYVKREEPKKEEPKKEEPKKEEEPKNEEEPKKEEPKKEDNDKDKDKDNDAEMKDKSEDKTKEEEAKKEEAKKEEASKEEEEETKKDDKMEVDEDDDEANNKDGGKKKKKDKKKITRDLIITGNFFNELKADAFNKMFEIEANLINVDRIVHETDEAKNDLETYIYALRDKIDSSHRDYIKESDREKLSSDLTAMEDWVYDEGDKANKTQFLERLKQLKDIGDPMDYKQWEFEHREQRVTNFKKLIFKYQQWITTNDEKYIHIGEDKRKEVKKYADDADSWLTNQQIKQDRLKKYETPTLKCKDIDNKYRELYDKCNVIVNTPKPKPKPKEEEPEKKEKDENTANGDTNKDGKKDQDNDNDNNNAGDNNNGGDAEMTDKSNNKESNDKPINTETGDDNKDKPKTGVDGMDVE